MSAQTKGSIGITIFGILAIGWGINTLDSFTNQILSLSLKTIEYGWADWVTYPPWFLSLVLGVGFIISGFGLLISESWARPALLIITGLTLWSLMNRLILIGPYSEGYFYLWSFTTLGLCIWYLNRKSIRTKFQNRINLTAITIIWIIVLSLEIIGAGIFWFKFGGYEMPPLKEAVYKSKDEPFYSQNYFRSPFPLKYTLVIPKGFTLHNLDRYSNGETFIWLTSRSKGSIINMRDQTIFSEMQESWKIYGYGNPELIAQKFFSEKYGLYLVILRIIATVSAEGFDQVEQAQINNLRGFIRKGRTNKTHIAEYYLFQGHEEIGGGTIFFKKDESVLNQRTLDEIISSMKLQNKPLMSAQEYFREGMILFNRKDYEKAKFSFASALYLDWQNSKYQYYLGRAFFKTENWNSAEMRLKKAVSLQPDFPEARKLLEKVEGKQISK